MTPILAQVAGISLIYFAAVILSLSWAAAAGAPASVLVGGQKVRVIVADTDALREKGLGGHAGLAPDEGMLFVFEEDAPYGFWMKGMLFSIDILWLDRERKIVHIAPSVSPQTYPQSYAPPVPARYVLELPAGFASRHNVRVGQSVAW